MLAQEEEGGERRRLGESLSRAQSSRAAIITGVGATEFGSSDSHAAVAAYGIRIWRPGVLLSDCLCARPPHLPMSSVSSSPSPAPHPGL